MCKNRSLYYTSGHQPISSPNIHKFPLERRSASGIYHVVSNHADPARLPLQKHDLNLVIMIFSTFTKRALGLALFLTSFFSSATAQDVTENGECWSACEPRALAGFIQAQNSTSVNSSSEFIGMQLFEENSTTPFRFVSVNAPNLHRLEMSSSNSQLVGKPSRAEIWDILCSVQQLGGQVVRGYTLSYGNDSSFHIQGQELAQIGQQNEELLPELTFNEEWFEILDSVLEAAGHIPHYIPAAAMSSTDRVHERVQALWVFE